VVQIYMKNPIKFLDPIAKPFEKKKKNLNGTNTHQIGFGFSTVTTYNRIMCQNCLKYFVNALI